MKLMGQLKIGFESRLCQKQKNLWTFSPRCRSFRVRKDDDQSNGKIA